MKATENYLHSVFMSLATILHKQQKDVRKELAAFVRLRSSKGCKWLRKLLTVLVGKAEGTLEEQPDLFTKQTYKGSQFVLAIACLRYHLDVFVVKSPELDSPPLAPLQLRQKVMDSKPPASEFAQEQAPENRPKAVFFAHDNSKKPLLNIPPNHFVLLEPSEDVKRKFSDLLFPTDGVRESKEADVDFTVKAATTNADDADMQIDSKSDAASESSRSYGPAAKVCHHESLLLVFVNNNLVCQGAAEPELEEEPPMRGVGANVNLALVPNSPIVEPAPMEQDDHPSKHSVSEGETVYSENARDAVSSQQIV